MHSQVKSLLKTSICTYVHRDYLNILFLITHTDCLLFLPLAVTELKIMADLSHQSVQNEELTGQSSNVAFMLNGQFLKIRNIIQFIALLIWTKVVPVKRVTLPAESTLPSVRMTKKLPRLTELMAGRPSSEFTQTLNLHLAKASQSVYRHGKKSSQVEG